MTLTWMDQLSAEDKQTIFLPLKSGKLRNAAPVLITITASSDHKKEAALTTRGMLVTMDDYWGLCFHEITLEQPFGVLTYAECEEDSVTITRISDTITTVIHKMDNTYVISHDNPIGKLTTRIFTNTVRIQRHGRTGQVEIIYQIDFSGAYSPMKEVMTRKLHFRFRPCK